ncbi:MAG: WbqC family protein, partial [Acidobacteria bacterium]|nr:WbqC family protein [Acidobacteriota bacterium]
ASHLKVAILQPSYLPWLGYFDQMRRVDVFVHYDDVQYDRDSWRNRNRIRTQQGWQWLTVPVRLGGRFGSSICEVEVDNRSDWARKHLLSLEQAYARARYVKQYLPRLESILSRKWERLVELNLALTAELASTLGLRAETRRSSGLQSRGSRTERLVAICRELGATHYLTGDAAKSYLDEPAFAQAGITVEYQSYRHPAYPQLHGGFIPYLSVVDLIFNCGPESLPMLKGDNP